MKIKVLALVMGICVCLTSCSTWNGMSKTGQGAIVGTGGGAALGSIIGAISGNTWLGTAIGAGVGAGAGALIGHRMDNIKKQATAQLPNASVETVKDQNGLDAVKVTFDSGILFKTGKYDLNATSKAELAKLANVIKQNPDVSIDVHGYTDSTGSDAVNNPLSVHRAESVANFLTESGASYSQMKNVNGHGAANPVASNATAEGRQQNRRVEIYLYASQEMINNANAQAN